MSDYIPANDAQFSLWAQAFGNGIEADPPRFMMTSAEAVSIQNAVQNFVEALLVSSTEETRTKGTIAAKDDSRSICESLCRQYAMFIKDNAGITDQDKIDIGVRPINPDREPINAPSTPPLLNILGNLPGQQTLRFVDSSSPETKAKPFGASELQLFLGVGTDEPAPLASCQFYGKFTKNPIEVEFDETDDGKMATYDARWASPRGEVGPWSLPATMRIAA